MAWRWLTGRTRGNGTTTQMDAGPGEAPPQHRLFWLGGRRHMADAAYLLPNDETEINRLDFQHYMLRHVLRGNYLAPIQAPARILDVGSGTGRWCTEMATLFPWAQVVGTDVVTPQEPLVPAGSRGQTDRPSNYTFVQGDVFQGLPFDDATFDFVHQRLLLFAIPAHRWPAVVAELVRVTRPGGWIELVETGPQQGGGPAMRQLVQWISTAMAGRGVDPLIGPRVGDFLRAAGIPRVESRSVQLDVGKAGGRVGALAETDVFAVMASVRAPLVAAGMVTEQHYNAALESARRDINRERCTLPFYFFYGQRP